MASINKAILIGNRGADPEIRYLPDGMPVASFSMATSESWKDANGVKHERTEWHRVVLRRGLAELASKYLCKGTSIYLEGKLRTRKWQDRNGVDHFTTEILGVDLQMLGKSSTSAEQKEPVATYQPESAGPSKDDDLPW